MATYIVVYIFSAYVNSDIGASIPKTNTVSTGSFHLRSCMETSCYDTNHFMPYKTILTITNRSKVDRAVGRI